MFSKISGFKSGVATLLFGLSALVPAAAQAQDAQEQLVAQMLSASPYACIAGANVMLNEQLTILLPPAVMKGMGNRMKKDVNWTPGDKTYDEVLAIISVALEMEIAKNGPVLDLPMRKIFETTVRQWTPEDRRYFSNFFATPGGKLYLTDLVDGAICTGWLLGLNKAPYTPFTGPAKARWEKLLASKSDLRAQFGAKLAALSPQERKDFEAAAEKLGDAFGNALKTLSTEALDINRFTAALEPSLPEIARALRKGQE